MLMKKYDEPQLKIISVNAADIRTQASGGDAAPDSIPVPEGPGALS